MRLHYENAGGEKGVTTFFYDEEGINHQARWELLDGSRSSNNYHFYDGKGNFIQKYREFSDKLTSIDTYLYDENNRLTAETFERSDGVSGRADYTYDAGGRLIKALFNQYKGWLTGDVIYDYEENVRVGGRIEQEGQKIGFIKYDYNAAGDLVREYWEFSNGWNQTFGYEYQAYAAASPKSYTSSNVFITNVDAYRLVKENYDYAQETGGPSFFEYDEKGRLAKKIFERSDGLRTETTYKYDEQGNLYESLRKRPKGMTSTFRYVFNANRKLVYRFYRSSDGKSGSERYDYDEEGLLVRAEYHAFDGWLSGVITFAHDGDGHLSKGLFKGKDGFDAEIAFTHDDHGNVIKIHWMFSFGKTQTYTFEYEKVSAP